MQTDKGNIVVVFDGQCVLCDRYVNWLAQKDINQKVYFTTFESDFIKKNHPYITLSNSVVVIDAKKKMYKKSRAVMHCLETIHYKTMMIKLLRLVPHQISDILYMFVARTRYTLFGRKAQCSVPNDVITKRILK